LNASTNEHWSVIAWLPTFNGDDGFGTGAVCFRDQPDYVHRPPLHRWHRQARPGQPGPVRPTGSARRAALVVGSGRESVVDRLIVCAGLHTDLVARLAGASVGPRIVPFRGEYLLVVPEHGYPQRPSPAATSCLAIAEHVADALG
jgi:hypothetical protein